MKPTEVKYTRRYNVGPYEHAEYEIHARLDDDGKESPTKVFKELQHHVDSAHAAAGSEMTETDTAMTAAAIDKGEKSAKAKGKNTKKEKAAKVPTSKASAEESEDETESMDGDGEDSDNAADVEGNDEADTELSADSADEDDAEASTKSSKKSKKQASTGTTSSKKKTFKKKPETYSRTNEIHKKLFGEQLTAYDKNWRTKNQDAAKATSKALEGEDFLNEEGKVVESFIKTLRATYMKNTKKK